MNNEAKVDKLGKEVSALARKVAEANFAYRAGRLTHIECLNWLVEYGNRASELLNPTARNTGQNEIQSDALRHLRQYNNHTRLIEFCAKHNLTLPKNEVWWFIRDQVEGHVKGIYTEEGKDVIRGVMRITNGIVAWVEKRDGTLIQVHNEWWQKDKVDSKVKYCIHCDNPIYRVENQDCEISWVDDLGESKCGEGVHESKKSDKPPKVKTLREKLLEEMFL